MFASGLTTHMEAFLVSQNSISSYPKEPTNKPLTLIVFA